ncbi:ribonuclease H-like domain-containing protein [Tanacetum coccineum]
MLVENRLPFDQGKLLFTQLLNLKLETEEESTMALELIKFVKQQLEEFEDSDDDDLAKSDHEEAERENNLVLLLLRLSQQLTAKRNQERVKSILFLAIPDEYLLKFHNVPDAKSLWAAIKSRFGGNDESKKMQRNVLKHQFENFTTAPNERLNLAVLSSENTSSTNEVSPASGDFGTTSPQLENEDLQQIDLDDLEELDLRWQVAILTVWVKRFIQKTGRNLDFKVKQLVRFDKSKVECYNCHKKGHFARECKSGRNQGKRSYSDNDRRNAPINESSSQALVAQDGLGGYDWSNDFDVELVNYALIAISSSSSSSSYDNENELSGGEKYEFQNYELKCREVKIDNLKMKLEKVVKERDELKVKIEKWEGSSKNLNKILNSQMSANDKNGLRYGTQLDEMSNKSETNSEISKKNEVNIEKPKSVYKSVVPKPKSIRDKVIMMNGDSDDDDDGVAGNPKTYLQDYAVVDSGCSSHMTGNKAYLLDYEHYNGGFMAFCVGVHHHTTNGHQFTMSNRHQELASPKQMTLGKDFSNPLIVDSLLKTIWFINALCYCNEALAIPGKTTTGNHVPLLPAMLAPAQGEGPAIPASSQPTPTGPTPTPVADEATTTGVEVEAEGAATTTTSLEAGLDSGNIHESPLRSHDAPLPEVNTSGSVEDSVKLKELMELVPKLALRIDFLEKELTETKQRVNTLEAAQKRKSKKVVLSNSEVSASREAQEQDISPALLDAAKTLTQVASGGVTTYNRRRRSEVNTGTEEVNTGSTPVKSANVFEETAKKTKKQLEQEKVGLAEAINLQAQLDAEVAEQIHKDEMISKRMKEEPELIDQQKKRMAQVQKDLPEEDFAKRMVDMVNQTKKYFEEERAKVKRSKPMTQSQLRTYMSTYLKNQGTWKLSQLKKLTFEEIKEKFDKLVEQIDTFVPMSLEATKARMKRYSEEIQTRTSKKQKIVHNSGSAELQEKVATKDVPMTEEKAGETIVPKEEEEDSETDKEENMEAIDATPVATKSHVFVNLERYFSKVQE